MIKNPIILLLSRGASEAELEAVEVIWGLVELVEMEAELEGKLEAGTAGRLEGIMEGKQEGTKDGRLTKWSSGVATKILLFFKK